MGHGQFVLRTFRGGSVGSVGAVYTCRFLQDPKYQCRYLVFQDCLPRETHVCGKTADVELKFAFLSKLFEISNLRGNGKRLAVSCRFLYFVMYCFNGCVWLILSLRQVQRKYFLILRLPNFSLTYVVGC